MKRPEPDGPRSPAATVVPERLAAVLRRALDAEQSAAGNQRIPAFRLTRHLLGGARRAGYTTSQLAGCLGVSVESVRTRGGSDGLVAVEDFATLAELDPQTVDQWATDGLVQHTVADDPGRRHCDASELLRALDRLDTPDADTT